MRSLSVLFLLVLLAACVEEGEEIKQSLTRSQFKRLIADESTKSWRLTGNGTGNFNECEDDLIYIFMKNSSDTGRLYITEPLLNCEGDTIMERDTLSTGLWAVNSSESSSLFDGELFIRDGEIETAWKVTDVNPENLVIVSESTDENNTLRLQSLEFD